MHSFRHILYKPGAIQVSDWLLPTGPDIHRQAAASFSDPARDLLRDPVHNFFSGIPPIDFKEIFQVYATEKLIKGGFRLDFPVYFIDIRTYM